MTQGKIVFVLLAVSAMLLFTGCSGGKHLDRQAIDASGRIAVVSVVVPRVADTAKEPNRAVLQASANRAFERVQAGLADAHTWTVMDPVKEQQGKTVQAFGKVNDADLAELITSPEERTRVAASVAQEMLRWKESFLGAEGLPIIPRMAFAVDGEGAQPENAVQEAMLQEAVRLCAALKVDAVAFVQLRASVTHPRENAFIVSDGRTDGMLSMVAAMVIVDKTGRIIVDLGRPLLAEGARTKDLLPIYRGEGRDFVKDENIDLGDTRKKVQQAFIALTDDAVADLLADLKTTAAK